MSGRCYDNDSAFQTIRELSTASLALAIDTYPP